MADNLLRLKLKMKNPREEANLKEAISSVPGFIIDANGTPDCDLMIMEIGADPDADFRFVEESRTNGRAGEIFLTSARKDPEVLLKALKMGVKEFFPQPLNRDEVAASLRKFKSEAGAMSREQGRPKNGIVVSVLGSKGGVGATTTAVNLAVSVKQAAGGKSVALMDMNGLQGDVSLLLDIKNSFSWADGAKDIDRMDSTYLLHTLYKHPAGIHVLPAPSRLDGMNAASPETTEKLVALMRSAFDIIIADVSRHFDTLSLRMLALSDIILIVSELNILSLVNARKLLDALQETGISYGKNIKLVINRYEKKSMVSGAEAEKTCGREIAVTLANDYETATSAVNSGRTLVEASGKSALSDDFRSLAFLLLHKQKVPREKSGLSIVKRNFREFASHIQKGILSQKT
jgi:pilus assembly protein CpaE